MIALALSLVLAAEVTPKGGEYRLGDGTRIVLKGLTRAPIRNGQVDFRKRPWWSVAGEPIPKPDIDHGLDDIDGTGDQVRVWWRIVPPPGRFVGRAVIDGAVVRPGAPHPEATYAGSLKPPEMEMVHTTVLPPNSRVVDVVFRIARENLLWRTAATAPVNASGALPYPRAGLFPPETFTFLLVEDPELAVEYVDAQGASVQVPLGVRIEPRRYCGRWVADLKGGESKDLDAWIEATVARNGRVVKRGLPVPTGAPRPWEPGVLGGEGTVRIDRSEDILAFRFLTQPWQYVRFRNLPLPP